MSSPGKVMNIKVVPNEQPNAPGTWITVPLRADEFLKFDETARLYAEDIPADHHAVSFDRFGESYSFKKFQETGKCE